MGKATVIKVDGTEAVLDHRPTLEEAQRIVGGYIELVRAKSTSGKVVTLIVDEDGKAKHKPVNKIITKTFGQSIYGGHIVGDTIVLEGWRTVG
jgi:hypothetical protein